MVEGSWGCGTCLQPHSDLKLMKWSLFFPRFINAQNHFSKHFHSKSGALVVPFLERVWIFSFYFLKKILLEYSCFTMLCQFLLYSKVNQLYVYIYPLFLGFSSHLGHYRALSRVPCAIQQILIRVWIFKDHLCLPFNSSNCKDTHVSLLHPSPSIAGEMQSIHSKAGSCSSAPTMCKLPRRNQGPLLPDL